MALNLFEDDSSKQAPRRVTLVRLAGEIARALVGVGRVAVEGEVYRPRVSRGGWTFFTLRDRAAQMEVVIPSSASRRSRAVDGQRVSVTGKLQWANEQGRLQLVAEEVVPVGSGAIAELIADVRRRLEAEGLLGARRRAMPALPASIGVVCGADAAVRRDIESVVAARFPGYPVVFEETTVSGPGASLSIVEALETVVGRPGVEVVILARGGGDGPSLLPWSSEEVCRAVAACRAPVVSAIGHESDRPLCDEVADLRCGTPSIAAAAVVPNREELSARLDGWFLSAEAAVLARAGEAGRRVSSVDPVRALSGGVERAASRLERGGQRLADCHPSRQLRVCQQLLAAADWRRSFGEVVGRAAGRLEAERRHMDALSPKRTLRRGFAVVAGPGGKVVRRAGDVRPGDRIEVELADGGLSAGVTEVRSGAVDTGWGETGSGETGSGETGWGETRSGGTRSGG
jgi:exodeoxyribonuclease VII large subunit